MTPTQRAIWGRVGAAIARSRHDPRELTAAARKSFLGRFEAQVRAEHSDLSEPEIQRRAGELRRAYFLKLAAQSSIARSKKRKAATDVTPVTAEAEGQANDRAAA